MRSVLKNRPLRLLFAANFISMIGSGMNSAAVIWYILQATGSEKVLAALVVMQAIPTLLLMPFSGVIIDREDRRRIVMLLDIARALIILVVALLCFHGSVQVWQLFVMNILVSTGFWMFWPTVNALLQELSSTSNLAESNAMLLAGFQGGWLIAGAIVGFVYNKIGIGGILFLDVASYGFSIACYAAVRKGRHVVHQHNPEFAHHSPFKRFFHEMKDGLLFVKDRPYVATIGTTWALFVAAMMVTSVVTAPISDKILHAGATGYGWLNAGWGIGAFLGSLVAARTLEKMGMRRAIVVAMLLLSAAMFALPFSAWLGVAAALFFVAGTARGIGGIGLSSCIMTVVPRHYMGRVQNLFSVLAIVVQIAMAPIVGGTAQGKGLMSAVMIIAAMYLLASFSGVLSARGPAIGPPVNDDVQSA